MSERLTLKLPLASTASAQGVRQLAPVEARTSAPGGSLSTFKVNCPTLAGDEPIQSMLGMLGIQEDAHADSVKPHATMAMTRLMILPIN